MHHHRRLAFHRRHREGGAGVAAGGLGNDFGFAIGGDRAAEDDEGDPAFAIGETAQIRIAGAAARQFGGEEAADFGLADQGRHRHARPEERRVVGVEHLDGQGGRRRQPQLAEVAVGLEGERGDFEAEAFRKLGVGPFELLDVKRVGAGQGGDVEAAVLVGPFAEGGFPSGGEPDGSVGDRIAVGGEQGAGEADRRSVRQDDVESPRASDVDSVDGDRFVARGRIEAHVVDTVRHFQRVGTFRVRRRFQSFFAGEYRDDGFRQWLRFFTGRLAAYRSREHGGVRRGSEAEGAKECRSRGDQGDPKTR